MFMFRSEGVTNRQVDFSDDWLWGWSALCQMRCVGRWAQCHGWGRFGEVNSTVVIAFLVYKVCHKVMTVAKVVEMRLSIDYAMLCQVSTTRFFKRISRPKKRTWHDMNLIWWAFLAPKGGRLGISLWRCGTPWRPRHEWRVDQGNLLHHHPADHHFRSPCKSCDEPGDVLKIYYIDFSQKDGICRLICSKNRVQSADVFNSCASVCGMKLGEFSHNVLHSKRPPRRN